MASLPRNLFCVALAHSLDDANLVEQLLQEYPQDTEACMAIALREIFSQYEDLPEWLLPIPFFTGQKLVQYLSVLWSSDSAVSKLSTAVNNDLVYLIPYLSRHNIDIRGGNDHIFETAVAKGYLNIAKLLMYYGISACLLHIAAHNDDIEMVKLLLTQHNCTTEDKSNGLLFAVEENNVDIAELLLEHNADVHQSDDDSIRFAAGNGHLEMIDLLLDFGASLHTYGYDNPLTMAAEEGKAEVVKLLLERKANIHADEDYALVRASENGHLAAMKVLLDNGADVHAGGNRALVQAAYGNKAAAVRLLLQHGADPHDNDDYPLIMARKEGHEDTLKVMMKYV